jgi:hypothetical protein
MLNTVGTPTQLNQKLFLFAIHIRGKTMEITGPVHIQNTQFDLNALQMLGGNRSFGPIKIDYSFDQASMTFKFDISFLGQNVYHGDLSPNDATFSRKFSAPGGKAEVALTLDMPNHRITYEIKASVGVPPFEKDWKFKGILFDW